MKADVRHQQEVEPEPQLVETPHFLAESGCCYMVLNGGVSLFATNAAASLPRLPIGVLPEGSLLFGADPELLGDEAILAVGGPDSLIFALPPTWRFKSPPLQLSAGLASWLTGVANGLAARIEPKPRPEFLLSASQGGTCPAARIFGCAEGVAWLSIPEGGAQLFGIEPVSGLMPLPAGAWITLDHPTAAQSLSWEEGLTLEEWPDAVARFNGAINELLPVVRGLAEADEHNRIRSRQAAEEVDGRLVLDRFAAILGNRTEAGQEQNSDGLIDVLRLIGRSLDIPIKRPAKSRLAHMDVAPTLDEIARASNIRLQTVALADKWWTQEGGPLIGRTNAGEPVALIWQGGYVAYDRNGKATRLDAASAATIEPEARLVFLPQGAKLKLGDMLRSSFTGSAGDIFGLLASVVFGSIVAQVLPLATSLVFGVLVPAAMHGALLQIGIVIIVVGIAGFVVQLAGDVARQRMTARGDSAIQRQVWDRVTSLPLSVLRRYSSADIAARVSSAVAVTSGIRLFAFGAASTLGVVISSLFVIASNSLPLSLVAAGLVAGHILVALLAGWLQAIAFSQGEQIMGTADSQMLQIVNAIVKLRSAAAEDRAVMRWGERFALLRSKTVNSRRVMNAYESWLSAYPILGTAALFATIHSVAVATPGAPPPLSMTAVVACITAFGLMLTTVGGFMRAVLALALQKPSWVYAKGLLEHQPEPTAGLSDPGRLNGEIELVRHQIK
jgi:hypothetical protein